MEQKTGTATAAGRSAYEAKVGAEAVLRSGAEIPSSKVWCTRSCTGNPSP